MPKLCFYVVLSMCYVLCLSSSYEERSQRTFKSGSRWVRGYIGTWVFKTTQAVLPCDGGRIGLLKMTE